MIVCSHCGRDNRDTSQYCQFCGEPLEAAAQEPAAQAAAYFAASLAQPSWPLPGDQPAPGGAEMWMPASADASAQAHSPVAVATQTVQNRIIIRPSSENGGPAGGQEREYVLDGRDVAIGRAPSCDIVLEGDQLASRRHALLRFKDGVYSIVDLGSSNGTFVNDVEIRESVSLHDGDRLSIGGHEITFSTSAAGQHATTPGLASEPLISRPLAETAPSISAVNVPSPEPEHDAAPAFAVAGAAPAAETAEPGSPPASWSPFEDAAPIQMPPPAEEYASQEQAEPDPFMAFIQAQHAQPVAPPSAASSALAAPMPEPAAPSGERPERGGATLQLNVLRAQLAEIGASLAEKADEEARRAERLRTTLLDVRARLVDLAEAQASQDESSAHLDELVAIARQAAENPRHLDYLSNLAAHAAAIADLLEARGAAVRDVEMTVKDVRDRLDEALEESAQ